MPRISDEENDARIRELKSMRAEVERLQLICDDQLIKIRQCMNTIGEHKCVAVAVDSDREGFNLITMIGFAVLGVLAGLYLGAKYF